MIDHPTVDAPTGRTVGAAVEVGVFVAGSGVRVAGCEYAMSCPACEPLNASLCTACPSTQMEVLGPELALPWASRQKAKAICDPPLVNVYGRLATLPETPIGPTSTRSTYKLQDEMPTKELTVTENVAATLAVMGYFHGRSISRKKKPASAV